MLLNDLIQIAYGALGLHPWEFDKYTFEDFVHKYKGYQDDRLEFVKALEGIANWAAYCQIMPTVDKKYKKITVDKIVPSRYEEPKKKVAKESDKERRARHLAYSRYLDQKKKSKNNNAGQ